MPISIKQMAQARATCTLAYADETVNITYCPDRLSEQTIKAMRKLTHTSADTVEDNAAALNETLCELVTEWDVLNEDGSMYPLTPEHMPALPLAFRAAVVNAVFEDIGHRTGHAGSEKAGA